MDRYLRSTAAQAARFYRSATFILERVDDPNAIVGFYTLAPHEYRDDEMDKTAARSLRVQNLRRIPVILLGQLGIATHFKGKGLGKFLLRNALGRSFAVANEIGGVAIITDPSDEEARGFYAKFDFQILHEEPFLRMLLPMRTLAKAKLRADEAVKADRGVRPD